MTQLIDLSSNKLGSLASHCFWWIFPDITMSWYWKDHIVQHRSFSISQILKVQWDFMRSHRPFWLMSSSPQRWHGIVDNNWNLKENMFIFPVITVPTDGLAPSGARASAGTVITKVGSRKYTGLALKGFELLLAYECRILAILCSGSEEALQYLKVHLGLFTVCSI